MKTEGWESSDTPERRQIRKRFQEDASFAQKALAGLAKGRARMLDRKTRTLPELRMMNTLIPLFGSEVTEQLLVVPYYVDFALPKLKVAILVDGCFWHCCPNHFPNPTTKMQMHNLIIDRKRDITLLKAGWTILHYWEHELEDKCLPTRLKKEILKCARL